MVHCFGLRSPRVDRQSLQSLFHPTDLSLLELTMSSTEQDTKEFHQVAAAAVELSNAHCSTEAVLTVQRSVRDWDNECRQTSLHYIPITTCPTSISPTLLDPSIQFRLPSPSGNKTFIMQKVTNESAKHKTCLEIWQGSSRLHRIPFTLGGSVIANDVTFGSPSWNHAETSVVFSAERKPPTTSHYWKPNQDNKESILLGSQHVLGRGVEEDWGERYPTQAPLLDLYLLHVETGRVERIRNVPGTVDETSTLSSVSLGQAVFHPTQDEIAYTAMDAGALGNMSRRLGMVYCRNRASRIYVSNVTRLLRRLSQEANDDKTDQEDDPECNCRTPDWPLARSPLYVKRTLEGASTTISLVALANPRGFCSHEGCMGLYVWDDNASSPQELVPVVDIPTKAPPQCLGMGFPGLFLGQLPSTGNLDVNYLFTMTVWGSVQRLIRIHLVTGDIALVDFDGSSEFSSHALLCPADQPGTIILSETSTTRPSQLWKLSGLLEDAVDKVVRAPAQSLGSLGTMAATSFSRVPPQVDISVDLQVVSVTPSTSAGEAATPAPIQAVVLLPKGKPHKVPLVVVPHGGPHSASSTATYSPGLAYLASQYAVVLPNYRGSIGFGQASLESLLTRIGRVDVDDVMTCTKFVVDKFADIVDAKKIGICGGSHGGFLTGHCTGQFPDYFQAAVMRNPVTNLASMVTATDIPDWCHAESRGSYDPSHFRGPTKEEVITMYDKSPIVHADKVKTPTLVALGMKDLRVPPSQGKEWYYTLRSQGVKTELLVYPEDNHALDRVTTEADHWIHIKEWFDTYLK